MKSQTAILLFSRSARAEADGKKIYFSRRKNKKATASLVDNAFKLVSKSGFSWYVSDETTQKGNDFGEKLIEAIASIFNKGHKKLIIVGNDCPALTTKKLQAAINELQQYDWVLGATPKGGVYLMGLSADTFDENCLKEISWHSSVVFSQLSANILTRGNSVTYIDKLDDVNNEADMIFFYNKKSFNSLILLLINLTVSGLLKYKLYTPKVLYAHKFKTYKHRGPPLNNHPLWV